MPRVFIPVAMRSLAANQTELVVSGKTVGEVIEQLDRQCPGIKDRLCAGNRLQPALQVSIGSSLATLGLRQPVSDEDEIHFLPAIGGG